MIIKKYCGFHIITKEVYIIPVIYDTNMYDKLVEVREEFYKLGYYILGDSVYVIESFLLPPYDSPNPRTLEDDFNFFQSSACITVECTFGEIDIWRGIFWKRLTGSLDHSTVIIDGAIPIHNFLVDYRNEQSKTNESTINRKLPCRFHFFTSMVLQFIYFSFHYNIIH